MIAVFPGILGAYLSMFHAEKEANHENKRCNFNLIPVDLLWINIVANFAGVCVKLGLRYVFEPNPFLLSPLLPISRSRPMPN